MLIRVTTAEVWQHHVAKFLGRFDVGFEVWLDVVKIVVDGLIQRNLPDDGILVDSAG